MKKRTFGFVLGLFTLFGCSKQATVESINRFGDPKLERIYELQDRQETQEVNSVTEVQEDPPSRGCGIGIRVNTRYVCRPVFARKHLLTDSKPEVRKGSSVCDRPDAGFRECGDAFYGLGE